MLFPIQYIYILNFVIVALFIVFVISGLKQGLLLKVLGCIGFIVMGFIAWFLSESLGKLFPIYPKDLTPMIGTFIEPVFYDYMNRICVFVVIFIILAIVVLCLRPILKMIGSLPVISQVNRVLGGIFGFLQGLILMVILSFIFVTPLFANGASVIDKSFLKPINVISNKVLFFAQGTLDQFTSIQKIVTPSTALTEHDISEIRGWLLDQNLESAQVEAFLQTLVGD